MNVTVYCVCNNIIEISYLHCSSTSLWHTYQRRSVLIFGCLDLICNRLEETEEMSDRDLMTEKQFQCFAGNT